MCDEARYQPAGFFYDKGMLRVTAVRRTNGRAAAGVACTHTYPDSAPLFTS